MAFYQLSCRVCHHVFYRITVRCGKLDAAVRCPLCHTTKVQKTYVRPKKTQIAAEAKACCREGGGCGCGH